VPQHVIGHQRIHIRRQGAELPLVGLDRPRVLLASKHELRFLLAGFLLPPRRQHLGHAHAENRDDHEDNGQRVAAIVRTSARFEWRALTG
jgi:hypothetical protein